MAKKKSCENIRCPRVLSEAERALYGWVDEEVFSQPSVVTAYMLSELCREMRLTEGGVAEEDYVTEAANPSDRLPFRAAKDREVMTGCRVAASQLHLNGWDFFRTFERACLHFDFRPSWRGRKLFDAFEESIQEFKWHYFKVLPFPGRRPFWLDDDGASFPWVYWNSEVGDYRVTTLDPLETLAFQFLQSLPN
ncbi:hypothetical protein PIB30_081348 [Stylosanthes scabra]|uniref:Uncharacterized protein n=1 Tax=Stylosanthes scabra TaxID=79078 RepID=A0ABU6WRK8_9FABA|nr:hypothetical protein [Stylosanthes scabra]